MILNRKQKIEYTNEPGLSYFREQIKSSEHQHRQQQVKLIRNHLLRKHKVLARMADTYIFKEKMFIPAAVILQGLKTVINFHVSYLLGNSASITGTNKAVEQFTDVYKKGSYSSVDWQILNDIITYGNAFEYVYLDDEGIIRSKVFRNQDVYPIYDGEGKYRYFVEYWKEKDNGVEHYVIYYPTHIDTYRNNMQVESRTNYTGLPIHYRAMDRGEVDVFGDPLTLDLIPLEDQIEALISKLTDAVEVLSLNPVGVMQGAVITDKDMIATNITGAVLNLMDGNKFEYANAEMDYNSIKFLYDCLISQYNLTACVPSSILGQSNVSNVSENSISIIYQLTENRGKQNMNSLMIGFKERWKYMRKLLALTNTPISDEDFNSINVVFNISKPTDTAQNIENMKTQYEMGAISKKTVMELSPYTTDTAQEITRLSEEDKTLADKTNLDSDSDANG